MLVCLIGKSGSGKTSIKRELELRYGFKPVVTYTTRKPRESEENHIDYHFVSEEEFRLLKSSSKLLESAVFGNHSYGTPDGDYNGKYIIVVDLEGFKEIKRKKGRETLGIYVDVSEEERRLRLLREGNSESDVSKRLSRDSGKFDGVYSAVDYTMLPSDNSISNNAQAINSLYSKLNK